MPALRRTFDNPILSGLAPDPSICRVGADFYLVSSSFEYFPGVPIFHSRDLVHWRALGHVLTRQSQLALHGVPSSGGIYAPTLRYFGGRFYLITTLVHARGRGGNFFVTAEDPAGPWSEPVWLDSEGFDPSLLFADGGVYYLRDGAGRDQSHPRIWQGRIDPSTGEILEPMRVIWEGTGGIWPEGAHVYAMRGRYYLFAAEGGTAYGHSEVVARGPTPHGPFQAYSGNPILGHGVRRDHPIQATGHADVVELDDGSVWAVFLGIRPQPGEHGGRFHHLGRETFLAPVHWSADGWPHIGSSDAGGGVELRMPAPDLPEHPFPPEPARDDFDREALGPAWCFVRNPDARDWSLSARRGCLRLHGSAVALGDVASPAAIVRRQQGFEARYRAALEFEPRQHNEAAGLVVRASDDYQYALAVRLGGDGRELALVRRLAGVPETVAHAPLPDGPIVLALDTDAGGYTFGVDVGGALRVLGRLPSRALSAEEIETGGGHHFTGAMIGLYASGNGRRSTVPADFDWFEQRL
jgi:alpha-N-arabinofuranosidase